MKMIQKDIDRAQEEANRTVDDTEKQIEKIKIIERAFLPNFNSNDFKGRDKNLDKLLTPQYYPWSTIKENLSFSSTIFRHSLRLTATIMIAFLIGNLLPFQNVYWILLTIVVIMRPGYGLTKERSFHRIIGTVAGGLIAFAILLVIQNHIILVKNLQSINHIKKISLILMVLVFFRFYILSTPTL